MSGDVLCPVGTATVLVRNVAVRGRVRTFVLRIGEAVEGTVEVRSGPLPFFLDAACRVFPLHDGLAVKRGYFDASFGLVVTPLADVQIRLECPSGGLAPARRPAPRASAGVPGNLWFGGDQPVAARLEADMAKYLVTASYTSDGVKGLMLEGGSKRRDAATAAVESVGGTMDCMYYAFGADDVVAIADLPDVASATAVSMIINSTGAVNLRLTPLLTVEDVDAAAAMTPAYRPPGS